MAKRYHAVKLDASEVTEDGFLVCDVAFTRAGIFVYRDGLGKVTRELRHPTEVFTQPSMESARAVPFTDTHPIDLVNRNNARELMRGWTGDTVKREDDLLTGSLKVVDGPTIDKIQSRDAVEVSMGYTCDMDETPGTYNGQPYDRVQKNIRYNHLALVAVGRAGSRVRLRLDGADAELCDDVGAASSGNNNPALGKELPMAKVKVDGVEFEVSESAALGLQAALTKRDTEITGLKQEATDAAKRADTAEAKADAAADELKKAQAERMDADQFNGAVAAKVQLLADATKLVDAETAAKFDGMSDREIMVAAVKAHSEGFDDKERSDDYVQARFDHALEQHSAKGAGEVNKAIAGTQDNRNDGYTGKDKRKESMRADTEAYKQPLGKRKAGRA